MALDEDAKSAEPGQKYDTVIVGAGIVGLAVARELLSRRPNSRIAIVEKESAVARHQTGHNSGVIHSGIYYTPGSLKARLCVEGARLMYEFCDENEIAYERCGKLIVALKDSELDGLAELEARGNANGVPGLRRVGPDEIREIEPQAQGIMALHSPNTGIVDYGQVSRALEQQLRDQGVDFTFGAEVASVERVGDTTVIEHSRGQVRADWAILCTGLWSDKLAASAGASPDPRILPFRGAYLHLASDQAPVVRGMIYPVPDPELPFLGVHVTKHIDGHVSLGPTAMLVGAREGYNPLRVNLADMVSTLSWPGTWRVARKFWKTGITEIRMATSRRMFVNACARYVPAVATTRLEKASSSGVRAQAVGRDGSLVDDFVISETPGASHVRNAPSPAATSAFALAKELVNRFEASTAP